MLESHRRIVVYPNRGQILRYSLLYLVIVALISPLVVIWTQGLISASWMQRVVFLPLWATGACATIGSGVLLPLTIYRVLVRKPSVIVTEDGIVDRCSLVAGGLGLIRWHEIVAIFPLEWGKGHAFLVILPSDPQEVRTRRGPFARLFLRIITLNLATGIGLPQWLCSMKSYDLWTLIQDRYIDALKANGIK